jgi:hypothetical protein
VATAPTRGICRLVENRWLHLIAITDGGSRFLRYAGGAKWKTVEAASLAAAQDRP